MGTNTQLFKMLTRWRLLALNQRLAAIYIPGLILVITLFSLFFLSSNHELQRQAFSSGIDLHNYHMIEGALIAFALFTALLAFHKKNRFFTIASAWVFCNLKLGSAALGLESFWLQQQLPEDSIIYTNQVLIGAYFILSQQLLQTGLSISPSSSKPNILLGALAFFMFIVALIPYPPLLNGLLPIATPIALLLGLVISIKYLGPKRSTLLAWQVVLLSTLVSGLISCVFSFFNLNPFLISNFNSFVLLLLANGMVALGIINRFKELRFMQLELRANYQNSPFSVIKIDHKGYILRSNRAFRRLCARLAIPQPHNWHSVFAEQNWKQVNNRTQSGEYTEIQIAVPTSPKAQNPLLALHANTIPEGYILTLQDITLYMNTLNRFKLMADNDPITQTLNQRGIEKSLKNIFDQLEDNQPCFVGYLDVNHVNYVNRVHGHAAGDCLLKEVSLRINEVLLQKYDYGRIDSDDFVFLFNNTSAEKAQQLATSITSLLNGSPIKTSTRDYRLNVHLGLIEVGSEMNAQAAVRTAQGACMDARLRNVPSLLYAHNSQEMQDRTEELQLFELLEDGITHSLFVEMQPMMNLKAPLSNMILEVLLRVRRANGGLIPLHTFIPAAEENGIISIIDKWVFIATLEWMSANQTYLDKVQQVNVNISGHSLNNNQFIDELFSILDKYAHLLHRLCVEITEGVALEDLDRTRIFMLKLQKKGIRIALDDFGAGYTSFSYLRELPANSIKIDGALIQDMLSKESNIAIVRTIVELAKNLGMQCVAEWVEDVETLAALKTLGVEYAQGFVISASRSPEEVLDANDIRDLIKDPEVLRFIEIVSKN